MHRISRFGSVGSRNGNRDQGVERQSSWHLSVLHSLDGSTEKPHRSWVAKFALSSEYVEDNKMARETLQEGTRDSLLKVAGSRNRSPLRALSCDS